MITKELIKAEIDRVPMKDIETVYKLIKVFTLSTDDLLKIAENRPRMTNEHPERRLGSLRDSGKILGDIITPISNT